MILAPLARGFAEPDDENCLLDMEWVEPRYSKKRVNAAGRALVDPKANDSEFFWALEVIGNWRASHNFPLNTFQNGLRRRGQRIDRECIVAQRIKRIRSIYDKLIRFPTMTLSQMQDIGGCRAVVSSVDDVVQLTDSYLESDIKHELHHVDNYIEMPQPSGYRGVHLIYRYNSDRKKTYNSLLIEVQLRSQYQHAWATAVETVGTFVRESLKSSRGSREWLRFFELMGTAIALIENTPPVYGTPDKIGNLRNELREFARRLDVAKVLTGYNTALSIVETEAKRSDHYFLIVLEPEQNTVSISTYTVRESKEASAAYLATERAIRKTPGADAVLVSVDSLSALRRAYPNYFADTALFLDLLDVAMSRGALRQDVG